MRAVNLIPTEDRKGAGGAAGRSGGIVYVVLGALALLVVVVALHTVLGTRADEQRARAVALEAQAQRVEAQATALQGRTSYASLEAKRVDTATALVRSRFDWAHALRELARVVPSDVTLEGLTASLAPGAGAASGAAAGSGLRSALPNPAFELKGCAGSQDEVASMLTDLRRIDEVVRVSLESSERAGDEAASAASSATDASGCAASGSRPTFSAVVFFAPPAGAAVPATSTTAAP